MTEIAISALVALSIVSAFLANSVLCEAEARDARKRRGMR